MDAACVCARSRAGCLTGEDQGIGGQTKLKVRLIEAAVAVAIVVAAVIVLTASFSASGLPHHTSLAAFERAIVADLVAPSARGGFAVSGVVSVSCDLPARWTTGKTFTCLAFRSGDIEVGSLSGVVRPYRHGRWQASLQWNAGA